jgi:polysaccharide deacetylase family protein (PEP-CTERM system associated)
MTKPTNSVHVECKQDLLSARGNVMTVDLEDYYCHLPIFLWDKYESRVVKTTRTILDLFDKYKVNATFFTIGYIAEKHPELIEEVVSRGHEIASHGYSHQNVKNMDVKEFEYDLKKSLEVLERISGEKVMGFRAPYCSINKENLWAFHVMRKNRIKYDCSLCPVRFHYGLPDDTPRHIYRTSYKDPLSEDPNSTFIEIPMNTLRLPLIGNIPVGGGHYLRFLPPNILKASIKKFNKCGFPAIFYIHPHDLDPAKPRVPNAAWHNYWGLKEATDKFRSVLEDFRFCSAREVIT